MAAACIASLPAISTASGADVERTAAGLRDLGLALDERAGTERRQRDHVGKRRRSAAPFRGYGLLLILEHLDGYHGLLAGLERIDVGIGQPVRSEDPLGAMRHRSTGNLSLYMELRKNEHSINPLPWLAAGKRKAKWMKFRKLLIAATAALLLAPAVHAAESEADGETYRLLNLFGDVFERVRSDHVEEATDKQLVEAAISGMLTSLDPHSGYLNADSYREMQVQTRGEFGGLGIEVTMENGLVKVVSPIDDTPAAQAGLEPGDFLTHIDGEPVLGLTLPEAVEKMRGRVGSKINLTVRREDSEPFEVSIIRDVIRIKSVRSRLEGKVGYVRISSFNEQTQENLEQALDELSREAGSALQGIVLDLRNNPGGLLSQAVAVSDAFLDKGEIVSTRSRRSEETQRFNARSGDLTNDLPMVVLINGGSASASEIVAGALQDHRRAIILGTKSFGKGSVQTIIPLTGYGAIRLTTARYYTPAGRSIQAKGIEPDIEVTQAKIENVEQVAGRSEADLRRALENDNDNGTEGAEPDAVEPDAVEPDAGEAGAAAPDKKDAEPQDYQLMRAVDLIRGIALYAEKLPVAAAVR